MRSRVPVYMQSVGTAFGGEDLELCVGFERSRQIEQITIYSCDDSVVRQAWADGLRDINWTRALRHRLLTAIGQCDGESAHVREIKFERNRTSNIGVRLF